MMNNQNMKIKNDLKKFKYKSYYGYYLIKY